MVLGLKPMGKPSTKKKIHKFWTEPRPCMVLGLKPMGKPSTKKEILQVLDRTKALHGPRTQAYGETKYKKENPQVLDRTKALHGPRTQAYGETKYKKGNLTSFGQNQGLAWSSDSSLWGNQVQKKEILQVLDRTKALHGPRTQAYGETKYKKGNLTSFGQNQGLAWSSDSSLCGNQLH